MLSIIFAGIISVLSLTTKLSKDGITKSGVKNLTAAGYVVLISSFILIFINIFKYQKEVSKKQYVQGKNIFISIKFRGADKRALDSIYNSIDDKLHIGAMLNNSFITFDLIKSPPQYYKSVIGGQWQFKLNSYNLRFDEHRLNFKIKDFKKGRFKANILGLDKLLCEFESISCFFSFTINEGEKLESIMFPLKYNNGNIDFGLNEFGM